MEVVPLMTSSDGASPFGRRDVAEWSRLDMRTGVTETARVETDRWAQATPTSKHSYGKVVDSRDRSLPDGSARQRQRQQLEVFQTAGPGGSLQVIRTQSVTSTNSSWRSTTSSATSSATSRAALPSFVRDFGDDLQMTLNPLDLSREKNKGSVGRSGSIGARRPPSRPRALPPPPPAPPAPELSVQEAVENIAASRDLPLGALHSLLSRQRSSSTEDLAALTGAEPDALRRSSRVRRSLQFSARSLEARGGVARLLLDLEDRDGVPQGSDPGRSVNNVSLDSFSRKFANAKMRHSYSESHDDDDDDVDAERKRVAAKRHSFVTVESLQEVRGRLKRLSSSEDGVDVGRTPDEVEKTPDETATSLVKSYVFGMEAMTRGGTGSLESRTGNRAVRSDEWYNRRKSYGFERVGGDASNDSSSTLSSGGERTALESTDSGIHQSSEMFSTPSWSSRRPVDDARRGGTTVVNLGGGDPGARGAMLSALLVNGVRGDDRRSTTVSTIPVTLSDDSPTVESRRLFYQQLAQGTTLSVEKTLKKSMDSAKAVADDWWMRPKFTEVALPSMAAKRHSFAGNGWRANGVDVDDEVKRHSIAVDEFQGDLVVAGAGELDRKNGGKKRVEFCKTEVHFAAEPGRFNIVETDEKPPSTNMFRRRRRSTNAALGVAVGSGLPEVRFGDHERVQAAKEAASPSLSTASQHGQRTTPRPTTLRLSLDEDVHDKEHQVYTESNATIRPGGDEDHDDDEHSGHLELTESSSDSRPRGILKPRVRPPAYLLGVAHQSDNEDRRQGHEADQSEERWGVRLRPAVAARDAVMPAEYSGQSELQKLLRSLRPAAPRLRGDADAVQRADWCATDRVNGNKEPDWVAAESRDVEKVPGWTPKGELGSDWSAKPMKLTDWSSKTEKSSEWLNETEKLADWSPKTERIADWAPKTDNGSDWQSKSMERQNKFAERLNAKVEKLTETRTDRLSDWSPKMGNASDRLTKSLERQTNFAERLVVKPEERRIEPRTGKLSDWSPKTKTLADWSPKTEKLSEWSPKTEKLSDWSPKTEKLSDWSSKSDKHADWSPKTEKLSDWSPKTEKLSDWSTKVEKLSDWSPKTEKLADWSPKTEKLADWLPKTEKLADWSVADRVRSVEQSKGFSTRVNFGPGETTVVAPATTTSTTSTEARRFSSGDRPKPVWQRREEALAAADGKPASTTTKITIDLTSLTLDLDTPHPRPTTSARSIGDRGVADGEGSPDKQENAFLRRLCAGGDRERGWDDVLVASSLPPGDCQTTPSWLDAETTWYDNKQYRCHEGGVEKSCVEQRTWMERSALTTTTTTTPKWKPRTSWGGRVWDKEAKGARWGDVERLATGSEEKGTPEELVVTESAHVAVERTTPERLVIDETAWKKPERRERNALSEPLVDETSWRSKKEPKQVGVWRKTVAENDLDVAEDKDCKNQPEVTLCGSNGVLPSTPVTTVSGLGAQLAAWRALCGESDSDSVSDQEADLEVRSFMSHEASGSWKRRRPGEGYAAVETEDKRMLHTATATASVPSYADSRGLRSVETLVNVRSGQPKITSISLRYHGDQAESNPTAFRAAKDDVGKETRVNGHHEAKKTTKFTSRTSISPERPAQEPVSKPSTGLFAVEGRKENCVVETARLVASFERNAPAKTVTEPTMLSAPRAEVREDVKDSVAESEFHRSAPGRARLRTTETTFSSAKSSTARSRGLDTEIGTVKKALSASPLAARRVTAASSSVGSSARELIGRRQAADAKPAETAKPRRPASLKDITETPVVNGIANGEADVVRHTFTSSTYQQRAECLEGRHRSASRSPSSERDVPRSASLSPVYQNRALYRENSGLEAEPDSVILAELTRAAEEILRAVHGYTDDETPPSTRPISEHPDDRRANHRRPLGTIAETHVMRRTEVKEARTQRETTRLASKAKLGPTSSNSSVEGGDPRRPIRAEAADKRPIRTETTEKRPIRGETSEKRPIRTERVSRTARMVQRASSRELLLQTHASSSEDVASGSEGPKQRAPPRRRSTATKSAVKPAPEPANATRSTRTSTARTKPRDSTTATEAAKKTPETKQYPLKEKTIPGIVSQRDRSSRGGAASAVRAKKSPSSRVTPLSAKAGK